MDKNKIDLLLDKLVLNQINEVEKADLKALLADNPEYKIDLKIRKDINKSMEYIGNEDLRKLLNKIHKEEIDVKRKTNSRLPWIIAISLGLLSIASFLFYNNTKQIQADPQELYAEFYSPYSLSTERGLSTEEILQSYLSAYQRKDYDKALEIIKPILKDQNNQIKLSTAIAAQEINDLPLSILLLNEIIASKDYYYQDHGHWYKALALIKQGKISQAKEDIEILTQNSKADHHQEAKALMEELE